MPATYVLTVAGSAGGYRALSGLLQLLPPRFAPAIAAVLHTQTRTGLAESLSFRSTLPVQVACSDDLLRPGRVYVAQGGTHLIVNPDARLTISTADRRRFFRPSADWLFESAAASFEERHIAIVLSGMMSDGAQALRAVKGLGGTVFVQSPLEAAFPDMPLAAIRSGCTDAILCLTEMAVAVENCLSRRDARRDAIAWNAPFAS